MYHFGDRFVIKSTDEFTNHNEVLLAQVEGNKICLIVIDTGNRISNPIEVSDTRNITDTEMYEMIDGYCSLNELHKTVCGRTAYEQKINELINWG